MSTLTYRLDFMTLRAALLGLLQVAPASGYDLAGRFQKGIGSYAWTASHSQIYPELNRMLRAGDVEVESIGARGRKVYRITDAGRAGLREWLLSPPVDRGNVRNEFVLRMYLLSTLERSEAVAILNGVREYAARQIDALETLRADYPNPSAGPALAAMYGIYAYTATRDWSEWALRQIGTERN